MKVGVHIHLFLIGIALFMTPVLGSLDVNLFGGVGKNASFYPLLLGVTLFFVENIARKSRLNFPRTKSAYAILAFCAVLLFSGAVNITTLPELRYQGTNGATRFFIQYGTFLFSVCVAWYVFIVCKKTGGYPLAYFEKFLVGSFVLAGAYCVLEIGAIWGNDTLRETMFFIDTFFRVGAEGERGLYMRLHSLAIEAPSFAMYMGLVFPFITSLCLQWKGWKKILAIGLTTYLILLIILSFSRTAYVVFLVELLCYILLFKKSLFNCAYFAVCILLIFFYYIVVDSDTFFLSIDPVKVVSSLFVSEGYYDASTMVRYGTTFAGLEIWKTAPIFGVGWGGYGFYSFDYLPAWIWHANAPDPFFWRDNSLINGVWPPIHNLYVRILAETGCVGLISWLSMNIFVIKEEFVILYHQVDLKEKIRIRNIVVSTFGMILYGLNSDALNLHFFWIVLGIVWFYLDAIQRGSINLNTNEGEQ